MRGFAAIGLVNPKTGANVGGVLRAAGCYESALVAISGERPEHYMGRLPTDTQKAFRHLPVLRVKDLFDAVPYDCIPIAVDILPNAKDLVNFVHPERAFYIFGPEDGTLGKAITDRCKWSLKIQTRWCMNLASCVNVVLYDRFAKQQRAAVHKT